MSPYDKCASCGGELTTGGCINFACSSKMQNPPGPYALITASEVHQLRADLATAQKEAKRCADGWDASGACLRALALDLAHTRAELAESRTAHANIRAEWLSTRAELAEVRLELDNVRVDMLAQLRHRENELAEARKVLEVAMRAAEIGGELCEQIQSERDSTRTELSAAQERVRTLETELDETETEGGEWQRRAESAEPIMAQALALCEKLDGPSSVACDIERALEALRG